MGMPKAHMAAKANAQGACPVDRPLTFAAHPAIPADADIQACGEGPFALSLSKGSSERAGLMVAKRTMAGAVPLLKSAPEAHAKQIDGEKPRC